MYKCNEEFINIVAPCKNINFSFIILSKQMIGISIATAYSDIRLKQLK